SLRASALNSGEWIIRFFLFVMIHLVSDCTHLTRCPKLLVRITLVCMNIEENELLEESGLDLLGAQCLHTLGIFRLT
ncbi:hypothetical protein, partial [Photobacterium sanctipauli]|uniref:hypothetical protein n=1 Tax=Photobacterium sanctipauli TaxID=1342794 RepID=UPI001B8782D0